MLAVVKTPHIKLLVEGEISKAFLSYLKHHFGNQLKIQDDDEEYINIEETEWYKEMSKKITPGDAIQCYRENYGWTQAELGKRMGGVSRQRVSDYENGRREVSKKMAKQLSKLFKVPVERFI